MKRWRWIVLPLLLFYGGYLVWYFAISPRLMLKRLEWQLPLAGASGLAAQPGHLAIDAAAHVYVLGADALRVYDSQRKQIWRYKPPKVSGLGMLPFSLSCMAPTADGGAYVLQYKVAATTTSTIGGATSELLRLDSSGAKVWAVPVLPGGVTCYYATLETFSGGLIIVDDNADIHFYNEQGKALGSLPASSSGLNWNMGSGVSSFELAGDGTVFIWDDKLGCRAFDTHGRIKWTYRHATQTAICAPLLLDEARGRLYAATPSSLSCLDAASGKLLWSNANVSQQITAMVLDSGGRLVYTSLSSFIQALDTQGKPAWKYDHGGASFLTADPRGNVYSMDGSGSLIGLDAGGKELWKHPVKLNSSSGYQYWLICGGDGRLYACDGNLLSCIDPSR